MAWYKRIKKGIVTMTSEKKEAPDGVWHKCSNCKETITKTELAESIYCCPHCGHHERVGSAQYFDILFDGKNKFEEIHSNLKAVDFLDFKDLKQYSDRLEQARKKTDLTDAVRAAYGKVNKQDLVVACMDFNFIGGSMGSVMGEKIARAIDYAMEKNCGFMMISKSGGARMMESAFSLMQMAKT